MQKARCGKPIHRLDDLPLAERFGDPMSADHEVFNIETSGVSQDWVIAMRSGFGTTTLAGYNGIRRDQRERRKPWLASDDSCPRSKNFDEFTGTISKVLFKA